jgi:hypothetical protein
LVGKLNGNTVPPQIISGLRRNKTVPISIPNPRKSTILQTEQFSIPNPGKSTILQTEQFSIPNPRKSTIPRSQ